jgi:ABC-type branched-subunit amino acid transport system ATPase component
MEERFILEGKGLVKHFGSLAVINGVELRVAEGTIHAIIGPNGAGKTTLFNMLTGFLKVTEGSFSFDGEDITDLDSYAISQKGIARSFQITSIFPKLTVAENVRIAAQSREKGRFSLLKNYRQLSSAMEKADAVLSSIGLLEKRDLEAGNLSYGEKRVLEIGISLATSPRLLMLDEPMAGLQKADLEWMMKLVKEISQSLTVLLIDHNIDLIISLSHIISVLNQGIKIAEGTPAEIRNNQKVQEAYLGGY